jgi:hypothetical protein
MGRKLGRTLTAFLLFACALGAATARPAVASVVLAERHHDPPVVHNIGQVQINGKDASLCQGQTDTYCVGKNAVLVREDRPGTVNFENGNPAGGNDIVELQLSLPPSSDYQISRAQLLLDSGESHDCPQERYSGQRFYCLALRAVEPRGFGEIDYFCNAGNDPTCIPENKFLLNVIFNDCAGQGKADKCKPPSHTKITKAQINGNEAAFSFKARHATGFMCTLFAGGSIVERGSCRSPQSVSGLPPGGYVFTVAGVNKAGPDPKPAKKRFSISGKRTARIGFWRFHGRSLFPWSQSRLKPPNA